MVNDINALEIQGVCKKFGETVILNNVQATIKPGIVTAFVGPNGAGKTTLFHIITGNLSADSGQILLNQRNITNLPPFVVADMGITKLFQDLRIFADMTVLENVLVALMDRHERKPSWAFDHLFKLKSFLTDHKKEALGYLEMVGIAEHKGKMAGSLSYGQQKLLALARIIARRPRYILLDEPTAGLSPVMVEQMVALISKMVKEMGLSVGLIEHNMKVVQKLANYVYFLHEGKVFCHGDAKTVFSNAEVKRIYIGLAKGEIK